MVAITKVIFTAFCVSYSACHHFPSPDLAGSEQKKSFVNQIFL